MIERSLMLRVLTALDAVDTSGIRETVLLDEIALEASRHLEASQIREHLSEAKRKGWAESYAGTLGETRYRILPSGRNALTDLRN
jgi:hypothetical protein